MFITSRLWYWLNYWRNFIDGMLLMLLISPCCFRLINKNEATNVICCSLIVEVFSNSRCNVDSITRCILLKWMVVNRLLWGAMCMFFIKTCPTTTTQQTPIQQYKSQVSYWLLTHFCILIDTLCCRECKNKTQSD